MADNPSSTTQSYNKPSEEQTMESHDNSEHVLPKDRAQPRKLTDLPDELILHVLSYLASGLTVQERAKQLPPLCLINRQFSRLSTAIVYEKVFCPASLDAADALLSNLRQKPRLQDFVREVSYEKWSIERDEDDFQRAGGVSLDTRNGSEMDKFEHWANENSSTAREASLAILLSLTPQVSTIIKTAGQSEWTESLDIPVWLDSILHAARGEKFYTVHNFNRLRRLHIYFSTNTLAHVSSIFRLPSLKALEYFSWYDSQVVVGSDSEREWGCSGAASEVQHLRFYFCRYNASDISQALASCKCLKSFHLKLGSYGGITSFFQGMAPALDQHSATLESLQIEETRTMHYARPADSLLNNLSNFSALRILKVPLYILTGRGPHSAIENCPNPSKLLPTSLNTLIIEAGVGKPERDFWREDLNDFLNDLRMHVPAHLPHLRRICTIIKANGYSTSPTNFIEIRKQFELLGVRFDWVVRYLERNQSKSPAHWLLRRPRLSLAGYYDSSVVYSSNAGPDGVELAQRFLPWNPLVVHPDEKLSPEEDLFPSRADEY